MFTYIRRSRKTLSSKQYHSLNAASSFLFMASVVIIGFLIMHIYYTFRVWVILNKEGFTTNIFRKGKKISNKKVNEYETQDAKDETQDAEDETQDAEDEPKIIIVTNTILHIIFLEKSFDWKRFIVPQEYVAKVLIDGFAEFTKREQEYKNLLLSSDGNGKAAINTYNENNDEYPHELESALWYKINGLITSHI